MFLFNKNIQFTFEKQINNKLNFFDLTISIINKKLEYSIYRKPKQTDDIIPHDSNHSYSQKKYFLIQYSIDLCIFH
jgi:hypothetical protein